MLLSVSDRRIMLPVFKPFPFSKIKRISKASSLSHITIHAGADPARPPAFPGTLNQSHQPDLPHVPRGRTGASLALWLQAPADGAVQVPCRHCSRAKQPATGTD